MTDIVKRLRKRARAEAKACLVGPAYGDPDAKPEDQLEWMAADEIERLRAALYDALKCAELQGGQRAAVDVLTKALYGEEEE